MTEAFFVGIFIGIIIGACLVGLVGVLAILTDRVPPHWYWSE